jgi:methionyl-tRNA synthetase
MYTYPSTQPPAQGFGGMEIGIIVLVILLVIWSYVWKSLALWHSARRDQKVWFIVFLFLNTAGILEIIYLFAVAKITKKPEQATAA